MFGRIAVDYAYFLQTFHPYRQFKTHVYNLLENYHYRNKKYFDFLMITLIFFSVYILIHQVKHILSPGWAFFNNYIVSIVFLIEYILRFWIYSDVSKSIIEQYEEDVFLHRNFSLRKALWNAFSKKLDFVFSPAAIIDLLAIVPFFHELRMLRVFVLFRVLKLFRYAKSLRRLVSILSSKKFEFITLVIFTLIVIMISSVLIYVMEANNPKSSITTLFDAIYWSVVTVFTVGYGDITPVTSEGRSVAMVVIILGIAVISFTTSIVVSAFTEKLDEIKKEKLIDDIARLKHFYLICGFSALSMEVIKGLKKRQIPIVVLEKNPEMVALARAHKLLALEYDSASIETYYRLNIRFSQQVESIILLHQTDIMNIFTALTIRELTKNIPIFAISNDIQNHKKMLMSGITTIINSHELIGLMGKILSTQPVAFEAIHSLRSGKSTTIIDEILVEKGMEKRFFALLDLPLFKYRLIFLGVFDRKKKEFYFNPENNIEFQEDDIAIVIANPALINEFKTKLHHREK